ncbi:MAG: hypothetical protein E6G14_12445 [Actinobacteria bacterium]|nr:MAG: hypothetical protein E6G14_12445 [Actinomycetota bacterium]
MVERLARVGNELDRCLTDRNGESIRAGGNEIDPELTAVEVGQRWKASGGSPKPDLNKPHLCALPTD